MNPFLLVVTSLTIIGLLTLVARIVLAIIHGAY